MWDTEEIKLAYIAIEIKKKKKGIINNE